MAVRNRNYNNYGFLTFRDTGSLRRRTSSRRRDLRDERNLDVPDLLLSSASATAQSAEGKVKDLTHESACCNRSQKKKSWWRTLFVRKSRDATKSSKKAEIRRSASQLTARSGAENKRSVQRRHSTSVDDSVVIVDESSILSTINDLVPLESNKATRTFQNGGALRAPITQHLSPLCKAKSFSMDCLESLRNKEATSAAMQFQHQLKTLTVDANTLVGERKEHKKDSEAVPHLKDNVQVTNSKQTLSMFGTKKQKPVKPARKKFSRSEKTKSMISYYPEEQSNAHGKKSGNLKRTKSLLSIKNLFGRKTSSQTSNGETICLGSKIQSKAKDVSDNTSRGASENFLNVYEKFPRRKSQARKVLVHIQTKEEIPVNNGVPQWDSISYLYAPISERRNLNKIGRATNSKPKMVVSSFIGNSDTRKRNTIHNLYSCIDENHQLTSSETNTSPCRISSLHDEPKKRESAKQSYAKDVDEPSGQKNNCQESDHRIKLHEKSASCCDDLLFGRSFILTGVATDEVPEVLARNYPYLATSSPVRSMAQCLRLAKQSGFAKKPTSTKTDLCTEQREDLNLSNSSPTGASPPDSKASVMPSKLADQALTRPHSFGQSVRSPPRRCFSDSDLSSFHLTPMTINRKYWTNKSEDYEKKGSRSRRARTDRMLHRMKERLLSLEKLSDQATNCRDPQVVSPVPSVDKPHKANVTASKSKPAAEANTKVKNLVAQQKSISGISTLPSAGTSSRKFNRLIKSRIERNNAQSSARRASAKLRCTERKASQTRPPTSESDYENLWPSNDQLCSSSPFTSCEPSTSGGQPSNRSVPGCAPGSATSSQNTWRKSEASFAPASSFTSADDDDAFVRCDRYDAVTQEGHRAAHADRHTESFLNTNSSSHAASPAVAKITENSATNGHDTFATKSGLHDRGEAQFFTGNEQNILDDTEIGKLGTSAFQNRTLCQAQSHLSQDTLHLPVGEYLSTYWTLPHKQQVCEWLGIENKPQSESFQAREQLLKTDKSSGERDQSFVWKYDFAAKTCLHGSSDPAETRENDSTKNTEAPAKLFEAHDIFLSSTPVKNYARHAAIVNEEFVSSADCVLGKRGTEQTVDRLNAAGAVTCLKVDEVPAQAFTTPPQFYEETNQPQTTVIVEGSSSSDTETSAERHSLSPNPSVIPTASDYFLKSLLIQQDEIKRTMMEEMRKISNKYHEVTSCSLEQPLFPVGHRQPTNTFVLGSSNDRLSESDSASQDTIKGSSRFSSSSDDTITNFTGEDGYATMSSIGSTTAQHGSIMCAETRFNSVNSSTESFRATAEKYVIPYRRENVTTEVGDFMEWDCDETDL